MMEQPQEPKIFAGAVRNRGYVLKASVLALLFWIVQFAYQYFVIDPVVNYALVRSLAFAGATLISISLIIGPLARLTKYNFIFHRRTTGVWGFTFVILHFLAVVALYFNYDVASIFAVPGAAILVLGLIAFWLYVPAYLTSTDWALRKLGFVKWKTLHRIVYMAYILSVLHYVMLANQGLSAPKIILLAATVLALLLQVAAFVKTVLRTKDRKAIVAGIVIIAFALAMFYLAFVLNWFK